MNIYHRLTLVLAATAMIAGCSKDSTLSEDSDSAIKYKVSFASVATKSSEIPADGGKLILSDKTGIVAVPMTGEVSGWLGGGCGFVTKGQLVNETGADDTPQNYGIETFTASAYDGATPIYSDEEVTYSDSKWSTSDTYYWPEETSLDFYAYANLPDESAYTSVTIAETGVTLSDYNVPGTASEQTDILLGSYHGYGFGSGTAEIRFEHPLTAVRFLYGYIEGNPGIKSISLEGVATSGTAAMDAEEQIEWSGVSDFEHEVSQTDESGLGLSDIAGHTAKLIGEPFIIIPQDLAENNVTVTVTLDDDTIIEATLTTGEWKAGYTNTYTLGYGEPQGILSVSCDEDHVPYTGGTIDLSVTSYSYRGSTKTPLGWHLEYKDDLGEWHNVAGEQVDGWINISTTSGTGSVSGESSCATIAAAVVEHQTPSADEHSNILRGRAEIATEANPHDLSMHDIYGAPRSSGKPVTANSYYINAPGWYAFPLVYGNAIDFDKCPEDGNNEQAYNPGGTSATTQTFLSSFVNTHNVAISSPYIETDLFGPSAELDDWCAFPLWQDVVDQGIITDNASNCYVIDKSEASSRGLALGGKCGYVVFYVNKSSLSQGNVLIAVKNGNESGSYILWSWHIWVTDESLACRQLINQSGQSIEMMPLNLGWVDGAVTSIEKYAGKSIEMRAVQEATSQTAEFTLSRNEYILSVSSQGSCTTYEWGRKDPFIRGNGINNNELTTCSVHSGFSAITKQNANTHQPFSSIVRNPNMFLYSWDDLWYYATANSEVCEFRNLWSATCTGLESAAQCYASRPVKTVYDPCPPGFVVPQSNAFTGMVDGQIKYHVPNKIGSWDYGYCLKTGIGDESVFMGATGYRDCGNGNFGQTTQWSMIWTAAPFDYKQSHYLKISLYNPEKFESTGVDPTAYYTVNFGFAVRPVRE